MTVPAHILAIANKLRTCPKVVAECWNKLPGGRPQARIVTAEIMDLTGWLLEQAGTSSESSPPQTPRTSTARQGRRKR